MPMASMEAARRTNYVAGRPGGAARSSRRAILLGTLLPSSRSSRSSQRSSSPLRRARPSSSRIVAVAAGLSSTAIGVYGGVLVPGLLLLGLDARFAAALSLFLQVLVIPLAAGSHVRARQLLAQRRHPADHRRRDRRLHRAVLRGRAAQGRDRAAGRGDDRLRRRDRARHAPLQGPGRGPAGRDVPKRKVGGIGLAAGFASGISGAGWGPVGVKMLILSRIDPARPSARRSSRASSWPCRRWSATSSRQPRSRTSCPTGGARAPLFVASIAPMIPGAMLVSRLGRERATIAITLLSISLALPTLIFGH